MLPRTHRLPLAASQTPSRTLSPSLMSALSGHLPTLCGREHPKSWHGPQFLFLSCFQPMARQRGTPSGPLCDS